jgi:tetratricopeptide (TPR) repeat protein
MSNLFNELQNYPITPDEFWILGIVRLPGWVDDGQAPPYRLWAGLCAGEKAGVDISDPVAPSQKNNQLAIIALLQMARRAGYLPASLHVWDEAVGQFLSDELCIAKINVEVKLAEKHPAVGAILADMAKYQQEKPDLAGILEGDGVTLDHVRHFADAAAAFCAAEPWRVFDSDEDLIRIDSPTVPPLMSHLVVLGRAGQEFGIGFYKDETDFLDQREGRVTPATMSRMHRVFISRALPHELPIADADLWEDHQLPLARGYTLLPAILKPRTVERPDAETLALIEGILRALAASTETDLDAATWSRQVPTVSGPLQLTFSLVPLTEDSTPPFTSESMEQTLAQIAGQFSQESTGKLFTFDLSKSKTKSRPKALEPKQQAQELIYQAWECVGRKSVKLARQALELWPDCADAYNILAREFNSISEALDLYSKALAAAQRDLGPEFLQKAEGHFWGILETRPYMRALGGIAHALWRNGDHDRAIEHAQRMIQLNPGDNQGIRYPLLGWLLFQDRDREASALFKTTDEDSAWWTYGKTLVAFRLGGDAEPARREFKKAKKSNPHAIRYLSGDKPLPFVMPGYYGFGDENEAIFCARDLAPAWQKTPNAASWLSQQSKPKRKPRK